MTMNEHNINNTIHLQLYIINRDIPHGVQGIINKTNVQYTKALHLSHMRADIANRLHLQLDQIELLYHGNILDEDKPIQDYNMKSGEVVYVIRKENLPKTTPSPSQEEISEVNTDWDALMRMYKVTGLPDSQMAFCNAIKTYIEQDSMKELIESTPALANDPIGISFLSEPELIYCLQEEETFRNIKNKHPGVIQVIMKRLNILKQHEIAIFMDDSDGDAVNDEDDDVETHTITAEHLTAALALAGVAPGSTESTPGTSTTLPTPAPQGIRDLLGPLLTSESPSRSGSASTTATANRANRRITTDMISNALLQAMNASTPASVTAPSNAASNTSNSNESPSTDQPMTSGLNSAESPSAASETNSPGMSYNEQLAKMQEMGLENHWVNLRALVISSGDVNVAINLVLSGAIED